MLFCLGKASKYRVTPMPMPINRVPIFSDSVSIGTDFIGTDWNGIGNGSNFFIGPITDIIKSWPVSVYQRIVIVSHATLLTKIMLGNVYVNKSEPWMFEFSMYKQAGSTVTLERPKRRQIYGLPTQHFTWEIIRKAWRSIWHWQKVKLAIQMSGSI